MNEYIWIYYYNSINTVQLYCTSKNVSVIIDLSTCSFVINQKEFCFLFSNRAGYNFRSSKKKSAKTNLNFITIAIGRMFNCLCTMLWHSLEIFRSQIEYLKINIFFIYFIIYIMYHHQVIYTHIYKCTNNIIMKLLVTRSKIYKQLSTIKKSKHILGLFEQLILFLKKIYKSC